jgi:hypothetical protein
MKQVAMWKLVDVAPTHGFKECNTRRGDRSSSTIKLKPEEENNFINVIK